MISQYLIKIKRHGFKAQRGKNEQHTDRKGKKLKINPDRSKFHETEEVKRISMFTSCLICNNWDSKDIFL